jgi:hypothetical protein
VKKLQILSALETRDAVDALRFAGVLSMLDRGVLKRLEQDAPSSDCTNPQLTKLECMLLHRYRQMSETDREHLRRLAEMLTRT